MTAELQLILFDDTTARAWMPFALTRPVGELRFGAFTLRERAERFANGRCIGHLAGEELAPFDEPGAAPCMDPAALARSIDAPRLFLCARSVPAASARFTGSRTSGQVRLGGRVAGWYSAPGDPQPPGEFFDSPEAYVPEPPTIAALEGRLLEHVWQLITENPEQIARDFAALSAMAGGFAEPEHVHVLGSAADGLRVSATAHVEPGVVIDVRHGPVWIGEHVTVRAFTRLAGPAWICPHAIILGGSLDAVSIGPVCRVRGEVEETVLLGYSNKAHDGFLGHAYVGKWVNLGALTTNSDLKNNYGSVRLWTPDGDVDTGMMKLGCLLGDHTKTGIGVMLNTGTIVGAGSNLFGAVQPPKHVLPFSWGSGAALSEYRLDRFMAVAEQAMARRDVAMTPGVRAVLENAWHSTRRQ
jgi:UDP-N-acetylglucosamine diphosphorylase/glucosamine-1-phosphate N-acetyltransferase